MVKATDPIGPYQTAKSLQDLGLQVLPSRHAHQNKGPTVKWRDYQNKRITDTELRRWFRGNDPKNYWVLCGKLSGVVVLDTDSAEGEAWWRERIGDAMSATAQSKTAKGTHFWFKIPDGWTKPVQGWAVHPETHATDDISFDFRGEGGGVLAPPSVHETGVTYSWVVPWSALLDAPEELLTGAYRESAPAPKRSTQSADTSNGSGPQSTIIGDGVVRSMLVSLLETPPAQGGRNDWLARVAGHYAAQYRNQWDLYALHCQQANASCSPPLANEEFHKTIKSVWDKEHGKEAADQTGLHTYSADTGWIHGSGKRIFTQTRRVNPETGESEFDVDVWSNFDIKALGVSENAEGDEVDYWVRVFRDVGPVDAILPGRVLGDNARTAIWLANLRISILPPDSMYPKSGSYSVRLQRYIESQNPPKIRVTRVLGWDPAVMGGHGGFVTHEGVITEHGQEQFVEAGVRPDPALSSRGVAAHRYGFHGSKKEARSVLREVLTYQEETVCSVFGAWWAACLLKPQLEKAASLFPVMAIEAPSESGKTNGFFELMIQMNGNTRGETVPTFAALRNMAASHRNGIVWVDDLDSPAHLMELIRAATSSGTITKMGDSKSGAWTATSDSQIVAPLVLSGESLGMSGQKALIDRSVAIRAKSPVGRRSVKGDYQQWDDVLALRAQYPTGLSQLAGWFVQLALSQRNATLSALVDAKKTLKGTGRNADKNAILLAGARLLDYLTADSPAAVERAWGEGGVHYQRVLSWVGVQAAKYQATGNTLTTDILPWALAKYGWPTEPSFSQFGDHTPVFIENEHAAGQLGDDGPVVWFSCRMLAQSWKRENAGRVNDRTESEAAFRAQQQEAAPGKGAAKRLVGAPTGSQQIRYSQLTGELAERVIRASRR